MKNLWAIIIVMLLFLFVGCESDPNKNMRGEYKNLTHENIIEFDGCEYFQLDAYMGYSYTHKGNCKNPIHYHNKKDR